MGIFDRIFKRRKKAQYDFYLDDVISKSREVREMAQKQIEWEEKIEKISRFTIQLAEMDIDDKTEREEYLRACCEQMVSADAEIENQKQEYQQVNDCIADIQQFMDLPEDNKNSISILCKEVERLSNLRRQSFALGKNRLPEDKYLKYEQYREEMPRSIRKLEQEEKHFSEIKSDMQKLEGERAVLTFQKKSLLKQRANLRGLCYLTVIGLILFFAILFALKVIFEKDVYGGYMLMVIFIALAAGSLFFYLQKNNKDKADAARQMNRLITLLNRVKIKYVISKNAIDYVYSKFQVNSSHELRYEWEQYQQMKRDQEAVSRCGVELAQVEEDLSRLLSLYPIRKVDLWVRRSDILVDEKKLKQEMVVLEKQRKQLQESMSYNAETRQEAKNAIEEMLKKYPKYGQEILEFVEMVDKEM